jgi:hypothetical protein
MYNVLELVNTGDDEKSVAVTLLDISGVEVSSKDVDIPGKGQFDVAVNLLEGFRADAYGILKIEADSDGLDGRMSFYRYSANTSDLQFAFSLPFSDPILGRSAVGFNTYQPSANPADQIYQVPQWLTLVNLDPSVDREFLVHRYDFAGQFLGTASFIVAPLARRDVEVGLTFPGPNQVGLNVIEPRDPSSPYLAHLIRYGASADGFSFALPVVARAGTDQGKWVPVSNGAGAENWLEIINTRDEVAVVTFILRRYNALSLGFIMRLEAHEQRHFRISDWLDPNESAAVRIKGDLGSEIISQSMFYFRDNRGSLTTLYGVQPRQILDGAKTGSFNLYLRANNWLRIFQVDGLPTRQSQVRVTLYPPGEAVYERVFTVHNLTGRDISLGDLSPTALHPDTYGVITLEGPFLADVLRIRSTEAGVDFSMSTPVR